MCCGLVDTAKLWPSYFLWEFISRLNLAIVSTLTVHCQWEDQMVRNRTGHTDNGPTAALLNFLQQKRVYEILHCYLFNNKLDKSTRDLIGVMTVCFLLLIFGQIMDQWLCSSSFQSFPKSCHLVFVLHSTLKHSSTGILASICFRWQGVTGHLLLHSNAYLLLSVVTNNSSPLSFGVSPTNWLVGTDL